MFKQRTLATKTYCAQIVKSKYSKNSNIEVYKNSHRTIGKNCISNWSTKKMCKTKTHTQSSTYLSLREWKRYSEIDHKCGEFVCEAKRASVFTSINCATKMKRNEVVYERWTHTQSQMLLTGTHAHAYGSERWVWSQHICMPTAHAAHVNRIEVAEWSVSLCLSLFVFSLSFSLYSIFRFFFFLKCVVSVCVGVRLCVN